jgi:hypothetical protein
MSSIGPDQDLRPRTARNLCIENTPAALAAAGLIAGAAAAGQPWIGFLAVMPASAAGWHVVRTISNEWRYARSCRRVAAAREDRRRAELENVVVDQAHVAADGVTQEQQP